ncbi:MAG TPA: hypothetical protein VFI54_05565 [Solirubrobacteraceae bacterium]|nr:hypothetical protein [Solirubrobacteraceae bacterium]
MEVRSQAATARRGAILDAELVVVGVRRGLAHCEHDDEKADPCGHND